jgi:hypothetical protein
MDRLFLDANVLFSAAYRPDTGLLSLWKLKNVTLCSSRYAVEEARFNLDDDDQRARLETLTQHLHLFEAAARLAEWHFPSREGRPDFAGGYRSTRFAAFDRRCAPFRISFWASDRRRINSASWRIPAGAHLVAAISQPEVSVVQYL